MTKKIKNEKMNTFKHFSIFLARLVFTKLFCVCMYVYALYTEMSFYRITYSIIFLIDIFFFEIIMKTIREHSFA